MARQRRGLAILFAVAALVSGLGLEGCRPARPSNVPADSVYIVGAWGGWWDRCSYDPKQDANYCQIFNDVGGTISDGVFLPYDGGKAAKEAELKIISHSNLTGPNYVCLENGRMLIPKSQFDVQKRYLDWATGRSKTR
jgi:hypothetical protein